MALELEEEILFGLFRRLRGVFKLVENRFHLIMIILQGVHKKRIGRQKMINILARQEMLCYVNQYTDF